VRGELEARACDRRARPRMTACRLSGLETLPAVITRAGLQSLVKTPARSFRENQIVFAGSGPLALAFPAQLRSHGANVTLVLEAGRGPTARDAVRLLRAFGDGNERLLRDALAYRARLAATACRSGTGGSSCAPRVTGAWSGSCIAAADAQWRPVPGTEEG